MRPAPHRVAFVLTAAALFAMGAGSATADQTVICVEVPDVYSAYPRPMTMQGTDVCVPWPFMP